jgi:hypothetical protein
MANFKVYKEVSALPSILEPNALYLVRIGTGFDLYCSDVTGSVAHKINYPNNYRYPSGLSLVNSSNATSLGAMTLIANTYWFFPYTYARTLRASNLFIHVTTAGTAARVFLFETDLTTGLPKGQIWNSTLINITTTGVKSSSTVNFKTDSGFESRQLNTFLFEQGKQYWFGLVSTGVGQIRANTASLESWGLTSNAAISHNTHYRATAADDSTLDDPNLLTLAATTGALPSIGLNTTAV